MTAPDDAERYGALAPAGHEPPATQDAAVDDAMGVVRDVLTVPLEEQPAIYEHVHRALQDRLADVEG